MRRRPALLAALGAGGIVALCVLFVGVTIATAAPREQEVTLEDRAIPQDLLWPWVQHCEAQVDVETGTVMGWASTDENGHLEVQYGTMDDKGALTVDEATTARVSECLGSRRLEPNAVFLGLATEAERLLLYDWALTRQQPCLAERGISVELPPPADFLDQDNISWYLLNQYLWSDPTDMAALDFDELLDARLACPPVPPYLVERGLG